MRIIGIDPGLKATGYGIIDVVGSRPILVETGTIEPRQKDSLSDRLNKIYTLLGEVLDQHKPNILVLEKLYAHYKHPATASVIGHARGIVCLLCAQKKIKLIEQSVKRIRLAVVGNGNATKVQTQRVVANALKIKQEQLTLDASDALALALGQIHLQGRLL